MERQNTNKKEADDDTYKKLTLCLVFVSGIARNRVTMFKINRERENDPKRVDVCDRQTEGELTTAFLSC